MNGRSRTYSFGRSGSAQPSDHPGEIVPTKYVYGNSQRLTPLKRSSSLRSLKKFMDRVAHGGSVRKSSKLGDSFPNGKVSTGSRSSLGVEEAYASHRLSAPRSHPAPRARTPRETILSGIANHGSTCFMSAVAECLAHTDVLSEYLVGGLYHRELNPLSSKSKKFGTDGEITNVFAELLSSLWLNRYDPSVSTHFRDSVEHWSKGVFRAGYQHDAQEFLTWLLDKVHEDLNKGVSKKSKPFKTHPEDSEEDLAAKMWDLHVTQHSSFIQRHFHGLFRSTVTCPMCNYVSPTFDPFTCVSLSVPQKSNKPLFVVMVYHNRHPRLLRLGLNADMAATFGEVKQCLASEAKVEFGDLILGTMTEDGFGETLRDSVKVGYLGPNQAVIYAVEAPAPYIPGAARDGASTNGSIEQQEYITFVIVNTFVGSHGGKRKRYGSPVCLNVSREVSFTELWRVLLHAISVQLKYGVGPTEVTESVLRLRLHESSLLSEDTYINSSVPLPLYTEAFESALVKRNEGCGPNHVKIILEWKASAKEKFFVPVPEEIFDHVSSYDLQEEIDAPPTAVSLRQPPQICRDCLETFVHPERMSTDDWRCPNAKCGRSLGQASKRIMFRALPNILIIHLKRFKQAECGEHVKLDPLIKFPITGLDISPFVKTTKPHGGSVRKNSKNGLWPASTGHGSGRVKGRSPIPGSELLDEYGAPPPALNVYDLYAVCNHTGPSVHSGHYTAFCKNPLDSLWYSYDDEKVTRVGERDLVTKDAYMLFYERRAMTKSSSCYGTGDTSTAGLDHWIYRLDSQGNIVSDTDTASFVRGTRSYASVSSATGGPPAVPPKPQRRDPIPNFANHHTTSSPADRSRDVPNSGVSAATGSATLRANDATSTTHQPVGSRHSYDVTNGSGSGGGGSRTSASRPPRPPHVGGGHQSTAGSLKANGHIPQFRGHPPQSPGYAASQQALLQSSWATDLASSALSGGHAPRNIAQDHRKRSLDSLNAAAAAARYTQRIGTGSALETDL